MAYFMVYLKLPGVYARLKAGNVFAAIKECRDDSFGAYGVAATGEVLGLRYGTSATESVSARLLIPTF